MAEKKKKTPTIDDRLEALVGRHEALTQTVELLARMQLTTEREIQKWERLARMVATSHNKRITKLEGRAH